MLEFRILGPFEVLAHNEPVLLGGPKQRALLAILVLHRGEAVSSDRLVDQLWGDRPPATAVKTLQGYVSHLRKALGSEALLTRGGGYLLAVSAGDVDAERFEALAADARRALVDGDPIRARELLGTALGLWRGEAFADLRYESFAQGEIARLEEARIAALEDRIDSDLALGHHRGVVGELEETVGRHPRRERLRGQLMVALYRSGRHTDALDVYRRSRQTLIDELGLEPGPELRALEQRIVTHDATLEAPTATIPAPPMVGRSRASRARALIAVGGALLLGASIAAAIVGLTRGENVGLRVVPNSVAVIDTNTNRVVGEVAVGARPSAIAFGSGSLWVANLDDQTISRVDPTGLRTLRTIPVGAAPTGVAIAGGAVWVVGSSPTASFTSAIRIDPQFDAVGTTVRIGSVVPGSPGAVAGQPDTLWVAPSAGSLTRVDPWTGSILKQLDPNSAPAAIGLGRGAIWATDTSANNVTRVDPTGLVQALAVGHGPGAIAVSDDAVWVTDTGDDALVRIDPRTRAVATTIPVGHAPAGVALGDGSVWVANSGDGTVTRIDPATNRPIARIAVGGSPQSIAVAGGRLWVTVDAQTIPLTTRTASGSVARLDTPYDVTSMDPALVGDPLAARLLYATCAKLINYADKGGLAGAQLVPEVAQSLPTRSADGRSYTFTIRAGFRFSPPSHETVTAQTFKSSIERTLNPRMRSTAAGDFSDVVGLRAYAAGQAAHIVGVVARGNTLTIRLNAPAPDLPARITEPAFCAVPSNTPIDPRGVREIPSAGPYRVASYSPGQGVVLTRNPNYRGNRPHRLARIEVAVGIPSQRAIARVEAGVADYAVNGEFDPAQAAALAGRYGPGSPAARSGHQQYFVSTGPQLDFLALNTHRPLFADLRLRQAANYAIDRAALAGLGDEYSPLPEHPTDHYLPPGMPGFRDVHVYPLTPDRAKARRLAGGRSGATAVLYTCDVSPCDQQAQIIKTDLAAIGVRVQVKAFSDATLYTKTVTPGEPFDIVWAGWLPDYLDPSAMLNVLLANGTIIPTLDDPSYRAKLAATARLTGAERYLAYARLDADLARNAAPLVAFGNLSSYDFFSSRIGCQISGFYGVDLAALCVK